MLRPWICFPSKLPSKGVLCTLMAEKFRVRRDLGHQTSLVRFHAARYTVLCISFGNCSRFRHLDGPTSATVCQMGPEVGLMEASLASMFFLHGSKTTFMVVGFTSFGENLRYVYFGGSGELRDSPRYASYNMCLSKISEGLFAELGCPERMMSRREAQEGSTRATRHTPALRRTVCENVIGIGCFS